MYCVGRSFSLWAPAYTDALTCSALQSELTHCKLFAILSFMCYPESVDALTPVQSNNQAVCLLTSSKSLLSLNN